MNCAENSVPGDQIDVCSSRQGLIERPGAHFAAIRPCLIDCRHCPETISFVSAEIIRFCAVFGHVVKLPAAGMFANRLLVADAHSAVSAMRPRFGVRISEP